MLRVLTLSTLFPNRAQPVLGPFVERQTIGLAEHPDVALEVVAPVGVPPWPASRHPHYAPLLGLPPQEEWKGLIVHRPRFPVWPLVGTRRSAAALADALLPGLRRLRARFPFDVIDAEYFWPDGPAALRLSRALGIPFSIKARGSDVYYWGDRPGIGDQIREAAGEADGLLAVSDSLKAEMAARGMPADKIRVHRTGVDLDRFVPVDRAAAKARLGVDGPLIVTAGALIPRKGPAIALAALDRLPDATLIFVGDGPERPALERRASDRVRFLGSRPHSELPDLLGAADVTLLPTAAEGIANVWVESLACGTPVVTTDAGGAREVIAGPAAGRIAPRDPDAMAAAVRDILLAPPAPEAVRRHALPFSWDRNRDELFDHLAGLVRSRRSRPKAA